jgi:hypothetical protein
MIDSRGGSAIKSKAALGYNYILTYLLSKYLPSNI